MKQIDVSVITVSLNAVSCLEDCLESVRNQVGVTIEHIVVDGASLDGTVNLLNDQKDHHLRWTSEPDGGIADAMNKGVAMSSGRWLLFLQADDHLVSPDILQRCLQQVEDGTTMISGHIRLRHGDGSMHIFPTRGWVTKMLFKTTIPHQGALIRRDLFDRVGPYDTGLKIAMDYDWFLRAYWKREPVVLIDEVISEMSDCGVSSSMNRELLFKRFMEERVIHFNRAPGFQWRMLYGLYWLLYLPYRKLKYAIFRQRS